MHFTKMQGIGNDYIYVDCTKESVPDPGSLSVRISDRHFGIGSDGLILIMNSDQADFKMDMYNADGSQGAMCGNGIRCVGKYVYDHELTRKEKMTIETKSGIKTLQLLLNQGKVSGACVDMGVPVLEAEKIPIRSENEKVISEAISVGGTTYHMTGVSMGNPHAVVFIPGEPKDFPLETVGPIFENHEDFPDRVNTEFAHAVDRNTIRMRVWERGSGETMACGTGACATAVAGILNGYVQSPVTVCLTGGKLTIEWEGEGTSVRMTGPAVEVFEGEIDV